jgi:hypothetical protein
VMNLYEVLVPASGRGGKFSYEHHKKWDAFVTEVAGGVTVHKASKGEWRSPTGELHVDRMIPCKIACTHEQLHKIIDFTIKHYEQEAVMAYLVSEEVIIKHRDEVK